MSLLTSSVWSQGDLTSSHPDHSGRSALSVRFQLILVYWRDTLTKLPGVK